MVDQLFNKYTPLYISFAAATTLLCVYVLVSYLRNKEHRKPPAGLMICKTSCDLVFSITFFIMLFFVDRHNNNVDNDVISCNIFGPIFVIVFDASQFYFIMICWDLYRTLSNPFRKPSADSKKLHACVWAISAFLIVTVSPFNVFRYRVAYGICFSCNTGTKFNYYNLWLFYIPIFITNVTGFLVTFFAFRRLSNGLEKTFELRQQIIKKQLILVGLLTLLSVITIVSWGILIYAPTFNKSQDAECPLDDEYMCLTSYPTVKDCMDDEAYSNQQRLLLSTLVFLNGFFDAIGWYLIQRLDTKTNLNHKVQRQFDASSGITSLLKGTISIEEEMHNTGNNELNENCEQEQVLCNALRGEIISYMTAGLAESIKNTSTETYNRLYNYGASRDISLSNVEESVTSYTGDVGLLRAQSSSRSAYHTHHPHQNTIFDHLQCEEPEPQRAQYPMHLNHDPKTHKGVINQIFINLPNQSVPSKVYDTIKRTLPVITSVSPNGDDDSLDEDDEKKEETAADTNGMKPKMQTLYFEDAPCANHHHQQSTSATLFRSLSRTLSRVISPATATTSNTTHIHNMVTMTYDDDDNIVDKDDAESIATGVHVPFKDYAPHCFRYLRQQIHKVSDEEYLQSVRPPCFEEQSRLVKEKFSEGRSGAFFFFTHDSKYLIKTVTKKEATLLVKILPSFIQHFAQNPHSLINRFFGLHSITMYNLCLYFVVLENVFVAGSKPHEIYDIKGSWIDRHTNHHVESGRLMKDQDLHKTLKLLPNIAHNMYKQLKRDSKFLAQNNIMDYSVLLGIYYVGIDPSDVTNDRIMLSHHEAAASGGNYEPPMSNNNEEEEQNDEESVIISASNTEEFSPEELADGMRVLTTHNMMQQEEEEDVQRPRAPSYHSGLRKYAQKEKAVKARVIEGPGIYYLGIIDVLQEWNTVKKLERMAKIYLRCKAKDGVSCVEPTYYRKRFMRKMHRIGIRPNGQ